MLVLASSKKLGGRCVAGIDPNNEWIRPVSAEEHGTLYPTHCGGGYPDLLDVVQFRSEARVGTQAHPEDVLVEDGTWDVRGHKDPQEVCRRLARRTAPGPNLLTGRWASVSVQQVTDRGVYASLALVEPDEPVFSSESGKPRVSFDLRGVEYDLPLTDFEVAPVLMEDEGVWTYADLGFDEPSRLFLTISLSEPFNGRHYKLVAAVIAVP